VQKAKILITGASGLLGSNLKVLLGKNFDVIGIARNKMSGYVDNQVDIRDYKLINEFIQNLKPDIILHSAAIASHLLCDKEPDLAKSINLNSTKNLVNLAEEVNAKFIFISSDAVFKGDKGWYDETDETDPFTYYGELKVLAEQEIFKATKNFVIIRGSFFGNSIEKNKSIFEFFYYNLLANKKIYGYTDIFSNSVDVVNISSIIKTLIDYSKNGLYHYGTSNKYSKYDLGVAIAKNVGLNDSLIEPVKSSDINDPYFSARDLSLATQKISLLEGIVIPDMNDCLIKVFNNLKK